MWKNLLAVAILSIGSPVVAEQNSEQSRSGSSVRPVHAGTAYEIAKITNSEHVSLLQLDKLLNDTLPRQLAANPDFVEMETTFPGITAKLMAAMKTVMVKELLPRLPTLWSRLAGVFAENLTESEAREILAFYKSPAGSRVIDVISRNADFSYAMKRALESDTYEVTSEDLTAGTRVGLKAAAREWSPADIAEIQRFETGPLGPKLRLVMPKVQAEIAAWSNEPSPEIEAKMEAAVVAVVQSYLDGKEH